MKYLLYGALILMAMSGCAGHKGQVSVQTEKYLAFTFDDAPSAKTDKLLEVLKEHDIKATFFILGECTTWYPDGAEKIFSAGHELGNHSDKISGFGDLINDETTVRNSLTFTSEAIRNVTGEYPKLFRSHISYSDTIGKVSYGMGMASIGTEITSRDWDKTYTTEKIIAEILGCNIKDGGVILMHEHHEGDLERSINALPVIIAELRKQGYQFLTVTELAEKKGVDLKAGNYYPGLY